VVLVVGFGTDVSSGSGLVVAVAVTEGLVVVAGCVVEADGPGELLVGAAATEDVDSTVLSVGGGTCEPGATVESATASGVVAVLGVDEPLTPTAAAVLAVSTTRSVAVVRRATIAATPTRRTTATAAPSSRRCLRWYLRSFSRTTSYMSSTDLIR
jgi:hypothetical protein